MNLTENEKALEIAISLFNDSVIDENGLDAILDSIPLINAVSEIEEKDIEFIF